ncbi:hypothetical protein A2223_02300 [Candidatus Falkowbacteria bacterium RIFOXYA2_FULL_35_8]|nr:MAG: hypothetical protein A2223_02300 [Candidatus Falkowbacteria bacterium RIFOXYA2_FULL_35_8]
MDLIEVFKMPSSAGIAGRTSSITNAFVNSIIPAIFPSEKEIQESLDILGLGAGDLRCAYCGNIATEWDHLRPIVYNKMPTGYISDIYNLVPACGKYNQSKGNKHWRAWIMSGAKLSPKTRSVLYLEGKIKKLERYEKWKKVRPINYEEIVGKELWREYWGNCKKLHDDMMAAQTYSKKLKSVINKYLKK